MVEAQSGAQRSYKPMPLNASKAAVHHFAEQVALKVAYEPGSPMPQLVSRLGGKLAYKNPEPNSDQDLPESIVVRSLNDFTIYVPTITSSARDRFTIAHELGHLFLHYPVIAKHYPGAMMTATRWVDASDASQQRAEWEANWFAAAFLMPSGSFRSYFQSFGGSISAVAAKFGVSSSAAEVRAKSLQLV